VSEDGKTRTSANGTRWGATLQTAVRMWPTPRAVNPGSRPNGKGGKILEEEVRIAEGLRIRGEKLLPKDQEKQSGSLNPTWVEWLMGYPIGHTDLKDWVTPSSRKSRQKSSDA
jgi:hypothetical protein